MLGGRHHQDRDALPAGRLRHLRGLQGAPLQPGDAGDPLQGEEHRRGAGHDGVRGPGLLRERPAGARASSRPWTRSAWATSSWGSRPPPSRAARPSGSSSPRSSPSAAPAGRSTSWTSRRPASTSTTSSKLLGPATAGRVRQHRRGHRAQPGCHQDRRLDHRPGARGGRRRRPDHRRGHAGGGGPRSGVLHRALSPAHPPSERAKVGGPPARRRRGKNRSGALTPGPSPPDSREILFRRPAW